jgi:hypothetical protein
MTTRRVRDSSIGHCLIRSDLWYFASAVGSYLEFEHTGGGSLYMLVHRTTRQPTRRLPRMEGNT